MQLLDYLVILGYFLMMAGIGFWSMRKIKVQEDFFMGGRSFGKIMQTFAAFGAGTGSSDPVNTARTTYTSGVSGMWSVMTWLFVTPIYWFSGLWYRRMRHTTLADWFVERYESKLLGAAFAIFGVVYYILYGSMLFSAIGKVTAPILEFDAVNISGRTVGIEYILVPVIGVMVLVYGIAGGLRAAYYTDLVQGLCIILLSIVLIPYGLTALVEKFGDPNSDSMTDGFRIIHQQLPPEHFSLIGSAGSSEFPLYRIAAVVVILAVGAVVMPHMIVTGGGSAKTELNARVGVVVGNFLKRFCTVGWVLTALIALALYSDSPELTADPDKTWGVASRELLGPGLTGLMVACLLAALMSSVDAYMIVCSALVVRNIYVQFVRPDASEQQCLRIGRWAGIIVVVGAVLVSLYFMDVFKQLEITWVFPILFAAIFWIGMFWRRATTWAAWGTLLFTFSVFFVLPAVLPNVSGMRSRFVETNPQIKTVTVRKASPSDVAQRHARILAWQQNPKGESPAELQLGDPVEDVSVTGGSSIYWSGGVVAVDDSSNPLPSIKPIAEANAFFESETTQKYRMHFPEGTRLAGVGNLKWYYLAYGFADLQSLSTPVLNTLDLPLQIVVPFLVMMGLSLVTPRNRTETLDRYYAKMKTPVIPSHEEDEAALRDSLLRKDELEQRKMFPGSDWEFQKPTTQDVVGFVCSLAGCFLVIALAVWMASLGAGE
ncbi:MAG: sodium:solute symporter family protein [Planctomycetales bacterium]|nr:sodium:solute symporter family protein [Planctomycetales bacterium]